MTDFARFIPALDISRQLADVIDRRLREMFADTPFSLAFLGAGSDVLGFDSARSMDLDWGPRLTVVVPEGSVGDVRSRIGGALDTLLPSTINGFPTRFSRHTDGTLFADERGSMHRLEVSCLGDLLESMAGVKTVDEMTSADWLSTPMQSLLEFTSGAVFVDDTGELTCAREHFSFYPDDIWRYQLAALWMRVGQVNPFTGRTGEVEDVAGSAILTASIARDLMRIALLQSRRYAPYAKWLGTACRQLGVGAQMLRPLASALSAHTWRTREMGINAAGLMLMEQLNGLEMIDRIPSEPEQFHKRPFTVLPAERIAQALQGSLVGTECERLPPFVGGIDAVTDSTDALTNDAFRKMFRAMLETS